MTLIIFGEMVPLVVELVLGDELNNGVPRVFETVADACSQG